MWQLPESLREIEEAGDDSIVLELIDSFKSDTAGRLKQLTEALAVRNATALKAEAHSIRGSARQMGADKLADLCQALESGAMKMNWLELESQAKQTEILFAEISEAMSAYAAARRNA